MDLLREDITRYSRNTLVTTDTECFLAYTVTPSLHTCTVSVQPTDSTRDLCLSSWERLMSVAKVTSLYEYVIDKLYTKFHPPARPETHLQTRSYAAMHRPGGPSNQGNLGPRNHSSP